MIKDMNYNVNQIKQYNIYMNYEKKKTGKVKRKN